MKPGTIFDSHLPFGIAVLCICTFLFIGSATFNSANHLPTRAGQSRVSQDSAHFAIADFDGDLQPDLASIRVTREAASNAEYSLDLKFSSGPRPAIVILGPVGGLQITSQDVNGDEFADLVVTSLFDSQFVAILLNDGTGHFQIADRARFPEVGKRTNSTLRAPENTSADRFTLEDNRGSQGEAENPASRHKPREISAGSLSPTRFAVLSALARASAGRAPPIV